MVFDRLQRAPEQQREHGVFGQVRAFAEDVMDDVNCRLRHVRETASAAAVRQSARNARRNANRLDAVKITAIQSSTGSQYFKNARSLSMTDESANRRHRRNQNVNGICQTAPHLAQKDRLMGNLFYAQARRQH